MEPHELTGVDAINDAQDSALSTLRERIKARQASVFDLPPIENPFPVREIELIDVPEIDRPNEPEFSLERHAEIIFRLEALYNNYLYRAKKVFDEPSLQYHEDFESALKALCRTQEMLLSEGLKPRF